MTIHHLFTIQGLSVFIGELGAVVLGFVYAAVRGRLIDKCIEQSQISTT